MWEKIKRYRLVWQPLVLAVVVAALMLLAQYHVPGTERALARAALRSALSSDANLQENGRAVQAERIGSNMVVTFERTDGSAERGAVVFRRGWNGLWAPVYTRTTTYPIMEITIDGELGAVAAFAVGCPEEAVYWALESASHVPTEVEEPAVLQPIPASSFIQRFQWPEDGVCFWLYDADGHRLPQEKTGTPHGAIQNRSFEGLEEICIVVFLAGVAVAAVRLRSLRRQKREAQKETEP